MKEDFGDKEEKLVIFFCFCGMNNFHPLVKHIYKCIYFIVKNEFKLEMKFHGKSL